MAWSFPIGRLFGSELRVHATFFLLIAWIGVSGYSAAGASGAALYILYVLILFACVVAHEFGHALMARRFGIRTPDVTLLPIGGLARLERMPEKPSEEILVALAGPAVNVVIFAVLALIFGVDAAATPLSEMSLATLPSQIAVLNLVLAVFNLLPAFPMDGGRVLRALLALTTDRVRATRIAAIAGQVLAFGMGLFGLVAGNPMLLLIAFFIFVAAGAESADEQLRVVARRMMARDAMITTYDVLAPDDGLDTASAALIRTTQHEFPVIDPASGRFQGFLTRDALYRALAAAERPRRVADIMAGDIPRATLMEGLDIVLARMQPGTAAVAIMGEGERMIGYITRENVGELMVVANARRA